MEIQIFRQLLLDRIDLTADIFADIALRGTTDVKPMMWIAFFSYFIVALPVGYLCGFTWGGGVVGVWVAFPAGLFTAGFLFWLRFRYRLQQLMKK